MNRTIPYLLVILFAFSCGTRPEMSANELKEATLADATMPQSPASNPSAPGNDLYSNGAVRVIKTVNYRFKVEDVKKSTEAIEAAIKKYPAYISSSNLNLEHTMLENKITIRVQNEYFQDLLKDIDKQSVYTNFRNVQTEDVSKDFVDLESRLKTKREVEERYREILRKKAGTIEEVLQAEQQIGALHEEIEATIKRLNYLKDQVSYSTINLEFYQTISPVVVEREEVTMLEKFVIALAAGWKGVMIFLLALAHIWPLILLILGVLVIIKIRKGSLISRGATEIK
jgi:hypothetical protein